MGKYIPDYSWHCAGNYMGISRKLQRCYSNSLPRVWWSDKDTMAHKYNIPLITTLLLCGTAFCSSLLNIYFLRWALLFSAQRFSALPSSFSTLLNIFLSARQRRELLNREEKLLGIEEKTLCGGGGGGRGRVHDRKEKLLCRKGKGPSTRDLGQKAHIYKNTRFKRIITIGQLNKRTYRTRDGSRNTYWHNGFSVVGKYIASKFYMSKTPSRLIVLINHCINMGKIYFDPERKCAIRSQAVTNHSARYTLPFVLKEILTTVAVTNQSLWQMYFTIVLKLLWTTVADVHYHCSQAVINHSGRCTLSLFSSSYLPQWQMYF